MKLPIVDDLVVFTREDKGEFPYYDCESLANLCKRNAIKVYKNRKIESPKIYEKLKDFSPEMILVSTFDQKIPRKIIDIPLIGAINIHPSLLPLYRGPTPTNWAIINGERESGVTFHFIDEELDMGDILFQKRIPIGGLIDGELRKKLAKLASGMLPIFFDRYTKGKFEPKKQKKNPGSYYPKITSMKAISMLKSRNYNRHNLIRGLSPYPGIQILGENFNGMQE